MKMTHYAGIPGAEALCECHKCEADRKGLNQLPCWTTKIVPDKDGGVWAVSDMVVPKEGLAVGCTTSTPKEAPYDIVAEIVRLTAELAMLDLKLKIQSDLIHSTRETYDKRIAKLESGRNRHLHWTDMGR